MGGTGTPPAAGNVLLTGDAAGLVNPLQGEGIGPAMVSARAAAQAVIASPAGSPARAAAAYTQEIGELMRPYLAGAAALQEAMLARPRLASAGMRLLTAPPLRSLVAGTWSLYWNGLTDGAAPRPAARGAALVQAVAGRLADRGRGGGTGGRLQCLDASSSGAGQERSRPEAEITR
jgi:hypothetical protein